ncbi:T9SS-dependent choice-of-anchor J family protein [Flavobacterium pallidum]|uniref:Secretion system C-terminal sorting domain-containing protein n=1 Tax=Flavobacterium pallidum TaxID=2172098 RepID=A0A2S1SIU4_9FLAO|nr:T9SS type A sorting domain-containing protein [Flavobacterium pallidum]AWI26320.1 hypothetical protein HYN49_10640 [Flavobacterium pallidum]
MQKHITFILIFFISGFSTSVLRAQSSILEQTLLTTESFNTFTAVSVTGLQTWNFSPQYGAVCSGYVSGQNFENEDWLISPVMDLSQMDNVKLTFDHTRGSAAVMNIGVAEGRFKAFATDNYTGDTSTTTWTELEGLNQNLNAAWQFIPSGELTIPDAAKSANSRIAFRYISSTSPGATWEIKNVKVIGEPQSGTGAAIFKITNWNSEWLGCSTFGPTDEALQINNVASAMLSMNSDIYCLQEITNSPSNPSIDILVSLMGPDLWEGKIVPSLTDDCDQRQAIIYKKSRIQFVGATLLNNGLAAQGNSYYYNWASGRYPTLYNINFVAGSDLIPVSIVNVHAKSEDGNALSYTRRLGGSEGMKAILDGANYNARKLIIIGDFNDYLIGTSSTACSCTDSPFKNFMDDTANYSGITKDLINQGHPIIENTIISNELISNYVSGSAAKEVAVTQNISSYFSTTSDHYPISAMFQFSALGVTEVEDIKKSFLKIYPNPATTVLGFEVGSADANTVNMYDMTGRQMQVQKINANTLDVHTLPSGIYILKVGDKLGKFVKG